MGEITTFEAFAQRLNHTPLPNSMQEIGGSRPPRLADIGRLQLTLGGGRADGIIIAGYARTVAQNQPLPLDCLFNGERKATLLLAKLNEERIRQLTEGTLARRKLLEKMTMETISPSTHPQLGNFDETGSVALAAAMQYGLDNMHDLLHVIFSPPEAGSQGQKALLEKLSRFIALQRLGLLVQYQLAQEADKKHNIPEIPAQVTLRRPEVEADRFGYSQIIERERVTVEDFIRFHLMQGPLRKALVEHEKKEMSSKK